MILYILLGLVGNCDVLVYQFTPGLHRPKAHCKPADLKLLEVKVSPAQRAKKAFEVYRGLTELILARSVRPGLLIIVNIWLIIIVEFVFFVSI
jgi:hypothetical protein